MNLFTATRPERELERTLGVHDAAPKRGPRPKTLTQIVTKFWTQVNKGNKDECWDWAGCKNAEGYGLITINNRDWRAHRLAYLLEYGHIGEMMLICHKCDNPSCCNPDHLFQGTYQDNKTDCVLKCRVSSSLKPHQIYEIRSRYVPSDPLNGSTALALEFGVAEPTIRHVVKHRRWRHLP